MLGEVIGDAVGFGLRDGHMLVRFLRLIPAIPLTYRGAFARQPANQPGPVILASRPDKIGRLEIETGFSLAFHPVTLDTVLLNQLLRLGLIGSNNNRGVDISPTKVSSAPPTTIPFRTFMTAPFSKGETFSPLFRQQPRMHIGNILVAQRGTPGGHRPATVQHRVPE